MGSTGYGRFENYSINQKKGTGKDQSDFSCPTEIADIKLEDVSICFYYSNYSDVPLLEENVILKPTIENGRLVIINQKFETLGNLPTSYNYLIKCLEQGMHYEGVIRASGLSPLPFIVVDLYAK